MRGGGEDAEWSKAFLRDNVYENQKIQGFASRPGQSLKQNYAAKELEVKGTLRKMAVILIFSI